MKIENFVFKPAYESGQKPSLKAVFDALTNDSSVDGCDPDWRFEVMEKASKEDVKRVRSELAKGGTETEANRRLNIWPR